MSFAPTSNRYRVIPLSTDHCLSAEKSARSPGQNRYESRVTSNSPFGAVRLSRALRLGHWKIEKHFPNQDANPPHVAHRRRPRVFPFVSAPVDTRLLSHCFHPSLAVSDSTASESRASLRSLPSSRRQRSPTSSAPPSHRVFSFLSAPADRFANAFPPLPGRSHPRQKANTFLPGPFPSTLLPWSVELPALARKRTHPFPIPINEMLPSVVRRVDRGHVLLSDGCIPPAPAPISPPCDLPVIA